ncbi:MgtC/SapB family protein [Leptolyngbya sp. FACHB-321]|uniref:MgtC/SapB family protein n=1 Tax=Leptolyngbya sp. FACHB-321 TaxID=2692807 RepID=UPI0016821340|nr:MgtC/SapB family protein [Leptolyngbya sp. FACHB-321]MBD2038685.1 MgtC/SapB family protein [Leptolyngbya sp. FACHB-321]
MTVSVASLGAGAGEWWGLSWRLILAALLGGAIGVNRQMAGKAGGLRTHMLVSLGAALFLVIPTSIDATIHPDAISRSIQGVATGVGFLGAGEIVHQSRAKSGKPEVKGLTSAAAIWATAALGMIASAGLWQASLIGTLLTLFILGGAKWLEAFIPVKRKEE